MDYMHIYSIFSFKNSECNRAILQEKKSVFQEGEDGFPFLSVPF